MSDASGSHARTWRHLISTTITAALVLAGIAAAEPVMAVVKPSAPSGPPGLVLRSTIAPGLAPGTSRSVMLTASNAGPSDIVIIGVRLLQVTADDAHPNCVTEDFTMADVHQSASVPGHTNEYRLASGTLVYQNTSVNQDACKAATLTLTLSSTRA
jgi:hypothetical protein